MAETQLKTLFHFSFAVNDLERARRFYGEVLQCREGRKLPARADFNFFGHHLVAHLAPDEVVGSQARKIGESKKTPLRHFGVVMTLEGFRKTADRLAGAGVEFLNEPSVTQKGTIREQMLMTVT
ncbi:MAG: glyoxalase, partial [Burkholderiales bacterium]|nr:glyoxalase [Burkholderiales bacterium]